MVSLIYGNHLKTDKSQQNKSTTTKYKKGTKESKKEVKMKGQRQRGLLIFDAGDRAFWTAEGKTIKNLYQLPAAIENMSDEAFKSHANEAKNDFSTWVCDVFGERKLARKLADAKTRQEAQVTVLKHLVSMLNR